MRKFVRENSYEKIRTRQFVRENSYEKIRTRKFVRENSYEKIRTRKFVRENSYANVIRMNSYQLISWYEYIRIISYQISYEICRRSLCIFMYISVKWLRLFDITGVIAMSDFCHTLSNNIWCLCIKYIKQFFVRLLRRAKLILHSRNSGLPTGARTFFFAPEIPGVLRKIF